MKKILVPVDYTPDADQALRYAARLAHAAGAELLLLHGANLPELTFTFQGVAIRKLRSHAERIFAGSGVSVKFECHVQAEGWKQNLPDVVRQHGVQLLVLHPAPVVPAGALTEGSQVNAPALMKQTGCPVLVVPQQAVQNRLKNIIFATDFTDRDPEVIWKVEQFARLFRAKLALVQVYKRENRSELLHLKQAMLAVQKMLTYSKATVQLLEEEDVLEGVNELAEQQEADMLVLATRDAHLMKRLFNRNYLKTAAYHTRIPLLNFYQEKQKPCSGCCTNCKSDKTEQRAIPAIENLFWQ